MTSRTPEVMYVKEIITRRPIESNSGPSSQGPRMLPTEKGTRNRGALLELILKKSVRTSV